MNDESLFGPSEKEQAQKKIFISTFSMLAKLTDVDGEVDRTEVVAVDQFMRKVLNLDEQRRQFAGKIFNEARRSKLSFRDYALQYRDMLQGQPRMLEWMIDLLLRVSMADSVFTDNEEKLIRNACSIFSITEQRYQQLRARHVPPGADLNYAVLGCKPSSADDEIIKQYQKLIADYNPQRIKELNLPEEFVKLAEEKRAAIEKTFQDIKKARGF